MDRPHRLAERIVHVPHSGNDVVQSLVDQVAIAHEPFSECPIHGLPDQWVSCHVSLPFARPGGLCPCVSKRATTHVTMQSAEIQLRFRDLEAQF